MASRKERPTGDNVLFIRWTIYIVLAEGVEVGARARWYYCKEVNGYSGKTVLINLLYLLYNQCMQTSRIALCTPNALASG